MQKKLDPLFSALMLASAIAVILAGTFCLSHSIAQAEEPEPVVIVRYIPVYVESTPSPEVVLLAETAGQDAYDPAIPLDAELQAVLRETCAENDVPVALALGVIEVESGFHEGVVSECGAYGLMQLNPAYFLDGLSPADNLRAGVGYLGQLLERYGDTGAALTAYCVGYDAGGRTYAGEVLAAAERWEGHG